MSYRELTMIDVKELLRRWSAGQSNRKIARESGADRATVRRYVEIARELGLECGHEFTADTTCQDRENLIYSYGWQAHFHSI
jgi:response regulator of citrate/malate metabolism